MMKIKIQFKDRIETIEVPEKTSALELAQKLNQTAPHQALAVKKENKLYDLSCLLHDKDEITFVDFDSMEGKEVFWHSSAHILAQAITRLYPKAIPTIGPPIENGFYYDFANLHISEEDFGKIEEEMEKIIAANYKTAREIIPTKEKAKEIFQENKYKVELIEGFDDGEITLYRQGEFFDLCRGPHMPFLGKVKAIKILKTSGAYWKGDPNKEMLTRLYAISFPDRKLLKEYLHQVEEAKKRDHKILGPKLALFSLKEEAPGMPFFHPAGMVLWNKLLAYWRKRHEETGYVEIKTPLMLTKELWEISGHWENYRHNMYTSVIEEHDYAIKPMNCPGCMLFYKSQTHSYREFPLRVAEIGHVHRYEASGALSGLMRVRSFHQDDAHIFLEVDQVEEEVSRLIAFMETLYQTFQLSFELELSTRPKEGTIGSDEVWEKSTQALRNALNNSGINYVVKEGEGAFYGPKIDVHIKDALGRKWQCSTIQVDMALPERFDLTYDAKEGGRKRPVVIHRAIFGSIERFIGVLIEHFAGKFPLWLSPRQVKIIPVSDRHIPYGKIVLDRLQAERYQVDMDDSNESVSKKIREAQLLQYNYMLTLGDREEQNKTIALRTRDNQVLGEITLDHFLAMVNKERESYALVSTFEKT